MPNRLWDRLRSLGTGGRDLSKARSEIADFFDPDFYRTAYGDAIRGEQDLLRHYLHRGWKQGFDPSPDFSTDLYLRTNPDVADSGMNPLLHFVRHGRQEGRVGSKVTDPGAERAASAQGGGLEGWFDREFYLSSFSSGEKPADPINHYLNIGWKEGRDPAPWFSTRHYLALHADVAEAGKNPFVHYIFTGSREGRALVSLGKGAKDLYEAHDSAVNPGTAFEEIDPTIGAFRSKAARVLAFYLPQFHAIEVNDSNWGKGFTEWRNLARAMPRFNGHVQPRIPRDLGFYDLSQGDALRQQVDLAKSSGIDGFCFYYYWFDGTRVLEKPLERLLADPSIDMPFCLIWANENWTRTWDGAESDVILQQSYDPENDDALVSDWARHMLDDRYIRLEDRPLLIIYRPGQIPDAPKAIARWRALFEEKHGLNPVIMMVQGFGDIDPRPFGLDGAIEFPPHKLGQDLPPINSRLEWFDTNYKGHVLDYDDIVDASLAEDAPAFPLIKTAMPSWDNEARRPGRGMIIHGGTPEKFETWMSQLIERAGDCPAFGERIVCVNAWNEWAEGAVLEPDVHYGGAYLNSVARAVFNAPRAATTLINKVLIVGHDANRNGAQLLALNIGRTLRDHFGVTVAYVLLEDGPLLAEYEEIGTAVVLGHRPDEAQASLRTLWRAGFRHAITNTAASGSLVSPLKREGFSVISLIHELPGILDSHNLMDAAQDIALHSDRVIFPAGVVQKKFEEAAGAVRGASEVFPQGIYSTPVQLSEDDRTQLREELGIAPDAKIVLGAGYGDLRKGVDRFVAAGMALCKNREDLCFVWVGTMTREAHTWLEPEIAAAGLRDRIIITGYRQDAARFFALADLFYLSSREDPFPSVVLEAFANGLPIVGHRGCGGCDGLIDRHGILTDPLDMGAVQAAIVQSLDQDGALREDAAETRRLMVRQHYDFATYAFGLLRRASESLVPVSAIVPNYNYAEFLEGRLDSIFRQSYPIREILVLDDASSDNSLAVVQSFSETRRRKVSVHPNTSNSGSPFIQWQKGVELAQGDYVWIAEADDLAAPDFLEQLIGQMKAADAVLGFCDSRQIDENFLLLGESYQDYLNEIEQAAFSRSFEMSGPDFLRRFLSVKNVILNASGVVFQRQALQDALERIGSELTHYKVAGDWRLYVEICASGGTVCFNHRPMNVHRRHGVSVTHSLNAERHLSEIRALHDIVRSRVELNARLIELQERHYNDCASEIMRQDGSFTPSAPEDEAPQHRKTVADGAL